MCNVEMIICIVERVKNLVDFSCCVVRLCLDSVVVSVMVCLLMWNRIVICLGFVLFVMVFVIVLVMVWVLVVLLLKVVIFGICLSDF